MRNAKTLSALLLVSGLLVSGAAAEVLQSAYGGGVLWSLRDGAAIRLGHGGEEIRLSLPPAATIDDLEPTRQGWLAAGRMPAGDGTDLLIIGGDGDGSDLLPAPEPGHGRYRGQPSLVIDHGRLAGLVWLEGNGPTALEVWAAAWDGKEWQPSERVSSRGPGSQVAPAVTALDDGSWMLVWAAFDGSDDEIMWSRRSGGVWSRPLRVHPKNDVPDITPDVLAIGNVAAVAWSSFDGNDYRLRLSRFDRGIWQEPSTFGGRGSVEPSLLQADGRALVLFQTVESGSWSVLELDRRGGISRLATAFENTYDRPLLLVGEDGGVRLRWPTLESTARPSVEVFLDWQDLP